MCYPKKILFSDFSPCYIPPMPGFAEAIALIFASLQRGIGLGIGRHREAEPLLAQAWRYAGRVSARLLRLHALWRAGKLRPPRPRPPAPPATAEPKPRKPYARLPQRRAWLLRYHQDLANNGTQLRHLAGQPEMAEFLAAVPRAARLVRPLLHMLGTELAGTALAAPPRPKKPRPPRPRPPKPKILWGKYPRFNPDTYSPGKIPPFRKITPA
jgi:hypothetical protein